MPIADPVSATRAPQPGIPRFRVIGVRCSGWALLALALFTFTVDVGPFFSLPLIGLAAAYAFVGWTFARGLGSRTRQVLTCAVLVAGFCATLVPSVVRMASAGPWHRREQVLAHTVAARVASAERLLLARGDKPEDSDHLSALHVQIPSGCDVDIELAQASREVNVHCAGHFVDGYGTVSF